MLAGNRNHFITAFCPLTYPEHNFKLKVAILDNKYWPFPKFKRPVNRLDLPGSKILLRDSISLLYRAKIGESAVLTCRASGDPAPDIVFHKDSVREPFSSQGAQADSRIFTIQKKEGRITVAQIKVEPLLRYVFCKHPHKLCNLQNSCKYV